MDNQNLSETDEILIAKFYDGECNFWQKYRALRLIKNKPEASQFLAGLKECSITCKQNLDSERSAQRVDIGLAVLSHIAMEERGEILLGKRQLPRQAMFSNSRLSWAMALSTCAAMFIVAFARSGFDQDNKVIASNIVTDLNQAQSRSNANVINSPNLKYVSNNADRRIRRISRSRDKEASDFDFLKDNSAVEVDWVRSDGRVRMLNSPGNKAGIIWVKRNNQPTLSSINSSEPSDNGIRIIEKNVPWAMPAYK